MAPWATANTCQVADSIVASASYKPTVLLGCTRRQNLDQDPQMPAAAKMISEKLPESMLHLHECCY